MSKDLSSLFTRKVVQGTCGWSDQSLVSCGKFYPKKSLSATEKLSFYSREGGFGCVEVDSSNYAIPSVVNVENWINSTPKDFVFHFKAFGLLVNRSIQYNHLPKSIKDHLDMSTAFAQQNKYIGFDKIGENCVNQVWEMFNNSVQPAYNQNKLGAIIFQFQLNFTPSEASYSHIKYCSEKLDVRYKMAIEFRNRTWFSEPFYHETIAFLHTLRTEHGGVVIICCDDLESEVYLKESEFSGLLGVSERPKTTTAANNDNSGQNTGQNTHQNTNDSCSPDISNGNNNNSNIPNTINSNITTTISNKRLPIVLNLLASSLYVYIRVHRRYGKERVLSEEEINEWVNRLVDVACEVDDGNNNSANNTHSGCCVDSNCSISGITSNHVISSQKKTIGDSNSNHTINTTVNTNSIKATSTTTTGTTIAAATTSDSQPTVNYKLKGPIYFLWGTDHENQPILNAHNLCTKLLPYDLVDKNKKIYNVETKSNSIKNMFSKMTSSANNSSGSSNAGSGNIISNSSSNKNNDNYSGSINAASSSTPISSPIKSNNQTSSSNNSDTNSSSKRKSDVVNAADDRSNKKGSITSFFNRK